MAFGYDRATIAITPEIASSHVDAWAMLAETGTWWTAHERLAIAARVRRGFSQRSKPPWSRDLDGPESETIDPEILSIVDKLTFDAGAIDADWASDAISTIGDGAYVELIAIVATVVMIDVFAEAAGVDRTDLPDPASADGQPSRIRPDGLGDIGAHVAALDPFPAANVARALSLVPRANEMFRTVSVPTYSAPGFADLEWDTPLSRPQVELIASRVASMNSCFY